MSWVKIMRENGNIEVHNMTGCIIRKNVENVEVIIQSNNNLSFTLSPDSVFVSEDAIIEEVGTMLKTVLKSGYIMEIYDDEVRKYIKIGYEIGNKFEFKQFTKK